jgi:UDP-4-keto-D-FucNAc 4-reductase
MVFVSSIGVNGSHTSCRPFTEADTPRPVEPYGHSKWEAEQELARLLSGSAMEYVIVRPPLVYGSGCPGNFGRLVRLVARAPVVPLGSLNAPRSFIHVDNLVDALLCAAVHPGLNGKIFLLADGRDVSVGEVVRRLAEALGRGRHTVLNVPPWLLSTAAKLTGRTAAYAKLASALQVDASAFSRATGWRAPVDPTEGLHETASSAVECSNPSDTRNR